MQDALTRYSRIRQGIKSQHTSTEDTLASTAAMLVLADSLNNIAQAIQNLGNGDASTSQGAMEAAAQHIGEVLKDGLSDVASALGQEGAY